MSIIAGRIGIVVRTSYLSMVFHAIVSCSVMVIILAASPEVGLPSDGRV